MGRKKKEPQKAKATKKLFLGTKPKEEKAPRKRRTPKFKISAPAIASKYKEGMTLEEQCKICVRFCQMAHDNSWDCFDVPMSWRKENSQSTKQCYRLKESASAKDEDAVPDTED